MYTYQYMHMYIHNIDRLWSEWVADIKFGEDKLIKTVLDLNYRA